MFVVSYYCDFRKAHEGGLVDLWAETWERNMWLPRIAGPAHAMQSELFHALYTKAQVLPTVNAKNFELHCHLRWAAFAHYAKIAGEPIAVTDYDVFPIAPFKAGGIDFPCPYNGNLQCGPGFIVGDAAFFEKVCQRIIDYEPRPEDQHNGKPHVSDMVILHASRDLTPSIGDMVRCYGVDGWDRVPLTHFANGYMPKTNEPRYVQIKRILSDR